MTEQELQAIEKKNAEYGDTSMHSACFEYACDCHFAVPKLVAEVRRLRQQLNAVESDCDANNELERLKKAWEAECLR